MRCATHSACSGTASRSPSACSKRPPSTPSTRTVSSTGTRPSRTASGSGRRSWSPCTTPRCGARMSEEQRMDLARHEAASLASLGIWFEIILMQLLVRHIYDKSLTSNHVRYALTEIADECRHSMMFARMIKKGGAPAYPVPPDLPQPRPRPEDRLHHPGLLRGHPARRGDPRLDAAPDLPGRARPDPRARRHPHPCGRGGPPCPLRPRGVAAPDGHRAALGAGVDPDSAAARPPASSPTCFVNPKVYENVGLDRREAVAQVKASGHRREVMQSGAGRLTEFLDDIGVIRSTAL